MADTLSFGFGALLILWNFKNWELLDEVICLSHLQLILQILAKIAGSRVQTCMSSQGIKAFIEDFKDCLGARLPQRCATFLGVGSLTVWSPCG
jgi:hypothetical protein